MTSPRILLKAWGILPKKHLGQNFMQDPLYPKRIASHADIDEDDIVLEIGSGLGALTIPLARKVRKVIAVETDNRLVPLLKSELAVNGVTNVEVLEQDIRRMDLAALADANLRKLIVAGNLPFSISSQILMKLINSREAVSSAVLMFQKELAQRLEAKPNTKAYGRITVMLQYCSYIDPVCDVPSNAFYPRPGVDSRVLRITFHGSHSGQCDDEAFLFRVVKAGFGKRRKTMRNALAKSGLPIDSATASQILEENGIDPSRRAETLSIQEFVRLSNGLKRKTG